MYAHIEGAVAEKGADHIVLDAGGVGYLLTVSSAALAACPPAGQRMKLYTVLSVREDAMELFGFYSREEKSMFERLRGVSGVGPRTALAILSSLSVRDLTIALAGGDADSLTRAPGVGKKLAQRIAMELRDKITDAELKGEGIAPSVQPKAEGPEAEAVSALIALGYTSQEAARAVASAAKGGGTANDIIFRALREMGS